METRVPLANPFPGPRHHLPGVGLGNTENRRHIGIRRLEDLPRQKGDPLYGRKLFLARAETLTTATPPSPSSAFLPGGSFFRLERFLGFLAFGSDSETGPISSTELFLAFPTLSLHATTSCLVPGKVLT